MGFIIEIKEKTQLKSIIFSQFRKRRLSRRKKKQGFPPLLQTNLKTQSDPLYFLLQFLFLNLYISSPLINSQLMVLIRNPFVNLPYIFLLFKGETFQLKTHRFIYLITSPRKWSLYCPRSSNRPPPLNLRLSPAWSYYSVHCWSPLPFLGFPQHQERR